MIIPLRTDRPPKRTPVVTQGLIVANMLVYLAGVAGSFFGALDNPRVLTGLGHFDPEHFRVWQLITYQFLHDPGGIWHLAFNMLFLWVFGSAVEDRLGRIGFLGFYLAAGVVAGLAHMTVNRAPVIGASGSIAGVTGAFLALFPRSRIQILIFFFMIGFFSIPSLWFIAFYIGVDVLRQVGALFGEGGGQVAYMAHLAGYVFGFTTGFTLLATQVLKREEFDVFFLLTQARRRKAFRAASTPQPAGMWDSSQADTAKRLKKAAEIPPSPEDERRAELRAEINRLLAAGDIDGATKRYQVLLAETPPPTGDAATDDRTLSGNVLGEQGQLDVASHLFAAGAHADAARAYELLIQSYPSSSKADEVRLLLALLYTRHLGLPQRARELITKVRPRLRDEGHTALADQLLSELAT